LAANLLGVPKEENATENLLAETFEDVHIIMFMLIVVLLLQAFITFFIARQVADTWGSYSQSRAFGSSEDSLESRFVARGYLERRSNATAYRGIDLAFLKPFSFGRGLQERLKVRADPLHKLIMWRAVRHEFLFPRDQYARGEEVIREDPERGFLSFEDYLRKRLGKSLIELIEVDGQTWIASFCLLTPIAYCCLGLQYVTFLQVQCGIIWFLASVAAVISVVLEEDTYELTPKVPRDPRQTLQLFAGTSTNMLRRAAILAGSVQGTGEKLAWADADEYDDDRTSLTSIMGRRFRPGLTDAENSPRRPFLGRPLGYYRRRKLGTRFPESEVYIQVLRLLAFLNAICATCLIVTLLDKPPSKLEELGWFAFAAMGYIAQLSVAPSILRRLTIRTSIEGEKDVDCIQECISTAKRNQMRRLVILILVCGWEYSAAGKRELWTTSGSWTSSLAKKWRRRGDRLFEVLSQAQQKQIWQTFSAIDVDGNGVVTAQEMAFIFGPAHKQGLLSGTSVEDSLRNIIRAVDNLDTGCLSWERFRAMIMLATLDRTLEEQVLSIKHFFDTIDSNNDGEISSFQLANIVQKLRVGLQASDFTNLLYMQFSRAKPTITKGEFVEWLLPYLKSVSRTAAAR